MDDETKSGSTTRYVRNGTAWEFTFVIEHDPIGLANTTTAGIVKSKNADGKTFVETDGTMSVVGWDTLKTRVTTVESNLSALTQDSIPDGTTNKGYTQTEKTKLAGIAAGATANSSNATLLARANHTGTQAASTIVQDASNRFMTDAERTKLTGIATGAQVNVKPSWTAASGTAAEILNKPATMAPTAHTHTKSQISDFPATMPPTAHTHTASYTATISTTWSGTSAPYTQAVTVTGMLAADKPFIAPVLSTTVATALLQKEAWNQVGKIDTAANKITVTCYEEKPTIAIPIQLMVVR